MSFMGDLMWEERMEIHGWIMIGLGVATLAALYLKEYLKDRYW